MYFGKEGAPQVFQCGVTIIPKTKRCGKNNCGDCPHGPYWYARAPHTATVGGQRLDLYLGAYVKFGENDWQDNPPNISFNGVSLPQTMAPTPYQGDANAFVANAANGSWRDMTAALDVANTRGRTLGALAADLDRLYAYVTLRLTQANLKSSEAALDECQRLLQPLREAWMSISRPDGKHDA